MRRCDAGDVAGCGCGPDRGRGGAVGVGAVAAMTGPAPAPSHTCPHCGRSSVHPDDVEQRYCGACHHYCDLVDAHPHLVDDDPGEYAWDHPW